MASPASRESIRRRTRSTSVTTGLNEAETGCRARISATRTAPVTTLFSRSCRPGWSGREPGGGDARPDHRGDEERRAHQLGRGEAREPSAAHAATPPSSARDVGQRSGLDPVEDPDATLGALQQAGLVQHLEVVADRGLGQVEGVVEVADAGLAVRVRGHQGEQPQPHRVGERLEQRGRPLGALPAQRLLGQGRAAGDGLDGRELQQGLRHTSILTDVDVRGNLGHRPTSISRSTPCPDSSSPSTSTTSTPRSPSTASCSAPSLRRSATATPTSRWPSRRSSWS